MIQKIQERWSELDDKKLKTICTEFSLNQQTAQKYINMSQEDIDCLDKPNNCKKRKTVMDDYLNIIFKMLRDKIKPAVIMSYVVKKGYNGSLNTLETYIKLLARNNFGIRLAPNWAYTFGYPNDVIVIKRNEILKCITTKNPKTKKNETIVEYLAIIKEKYGIISVLEQAYNEFHEIIMGDKPEKLDLYIAKYENSVISGFVGGIRKDIIPVRNAIIYDESNGFVEGNNNKFKLLKRILYGRANLANLFKKCYVAFKTKSVNFNLSQLF